MKETTEVEGGEYPGCTGKGWKRERSRRREKREF